MSCPWNLSLCRWIISVSFVAHLSVLTYVPVKLIYSAAHDSCRYGHECSFLRLLICMCLETVYQFSNCFILSFVSDKPIFSLKELKAER